MLDLPYCLESFWEIGRQAKKIALTSYLITKAIAMDEFQVDRMRQILETKGAIWEEKKMMGGLCFMVDDKMCFGTYKGGLMARVEPTEIAVLTERVGATQMIHGGRPMTGYVFVEPEGLDAEADLAFWIEKCLAFNPKAKSSKKKKKR